MGVSKIVYGDKTLIDLTETTVTPSTLGKGTTAINSAGELIKGEVVFNNCIFRSRTSGEDMTLGTMSFVKKETSLYFTTDDASLELGTLTFS